MFIFSLILHALLIISTWEFERLLPVKLVIFRAQNLGFLFWTFRKKPYSLSSFISCLCSGLGSSVCCCYIMYHLKLGGRIGKCLSCVSWWTQFICFMLSGISARKIQSQGRINGLALESAEGLLAYILGIWCGLVGWNLSWVIGWNTSTLLSVYLLVLPHIMAAEAQRVRIPSKWFLLWRFNLTSHIRSLMP